MPRKGKRNTLSVRETAEIIEKGEQYIRLGLQSGRLPFGSAVQNEKGRWNYNIIKTKVYEYMGIAEKLEETKGA